MDWKREKLQSIWRMSKEKLIFLFCSGLLLFVISMPGEAENEYREAGSAVEVSAAGGKDGSMDGENDGSTDGGLQAAAKTVSAADPYEEELERRISELLSGVEGVGRAEVMVVLKSSEEKVIHVDKNSSVSTTEEKGEGGTSRIIKEEEISESAVMGNQSQSPIIEKELTPELSGIIISADGGGNAGVKAEISEAMEALLGLPVHKIKVLKRAGEQRK